MNEWRTGKATRTMSCVRCGFTINRGNHFMVNTWQTEIMPAPAFWYYHPKCGRNAKAYQLWSVKGF